MLLPQPSYQLSVILWNALSRCVLAVYAEQSTTAVGGLSIQEHGSSPAVTVAAKAVHPQACAVLGSALLAQQNTF